MSRSSQPELTWPQVVEKRLALWGIWAATGTGGGGKNMLAKMIRRAAGELPGDSLDVPRELTPELEGVEKSFCELAESTFPRDQLAYALLMQYFREAMDPQEIEAMYGWSPQKRMEELRIARRIFGRCLRRADQRIRNRELARKGKIA